MLGEPPGRGGDVEHRWRVGQLAQARRIARRRSGRARVTRALAAARAAARRAPYRARAPRHHRVLRSGVVGAPAAGSGRRAPGLDAPRQASASSSSQTGATVRGARRLEVGTADRRRRARLRRSAAQPHRGDVRRRSRDARPRALACGRACRRGLRSRSASACRTSSSSTRVAAGEVGDRPRDPQHAVVPARAERPACRRCPAPCAPRRVDALAERAACGSSARCGRAGCRRSRARWRSRAACDALAHARPTTRRPAPRSSAPSGARRRRAGPCRSSSGPLSRRRWRARSASRAAAARRCRRARTDTGSSPRRA